MEWLNRKLGQPIGTYRLPTEVEWEYACRAGTRGPYWTGSRLSTKQANYNGDGSSDESGRLSSTGSVGNVHAANAWNLWNMHGNIWEWCHDDWQAPYGGATSLELGWSAKPNYKITRGGSWKTPAKHCRSASSSPVRRDYRCDDVGFRATRTLSKNYVLCLSGSPAHMSGGYDCLP